ncbi:hypothetical protein DdX_20036 [Ditylenchus destructor]|uniref:Uncharacterized protein n=1 Tax=Ditylenchus destructor TaxID=166010 RepID=A0AAD4MHW8_9BILA|nr:hypothetical protein DdX_20036 [Ditylenchus destructor]
MLVHLEFSRVIEKPENLTMRQDRNSFSVSLKCVLTSLVNELNVVRDSSSPGQFITRDNSSPATIHHMRQFITCDNSSPGQFITCDNSSPATIHHP